MYGKVIDVVHTRNPKVRGTAFVVFRDLASSTSAMRGLDGEGFFGRQLKISYAKSTSHATVSLREGPEAVYAIKLGILNDRKSGTKLTVSGAQKKLIEDGKKRAREEAEEEEEDSDEEEEGQGNKKKGKTAEESDDDAMEEDSDEDDVPAPKAKEVKLPPPQQEVGDEPNPILFVQGLPGDVTSDMLSPLFQQYPGLVDLKVFRSTSGADNSNTGFVTYESTAQADTAKDVLDGFLLTKGVPLKVSWAKRA